MSVSVDILPCLNNAAQYDLVYNINLNHSHPSQQTCQRLLPTCQRLLPCFCRTQKKKSTADDIEFASDDIEFALNKTTMLWDSFDHADEYDLLTFWTLNWISICSYFKNILRIFQNNVTFYVHKERPEVKEVVRFEIRGNKSNSEPHIYEAYEAYKPWSHMTICSYVANSLKRCLCGCNISPWCVGCRASNIGCAILINAIVTSTTVVVASILLTAEQRSSNDGFQILKYLSPALTYLAVSFFMFVCIGFGGGSISSTAKIVLSREATKVVFKKLDTEPPDGWLCLDYDNSVLMPNQRLYFGYMICVMAKPQTQFKPLYDSKNSLEL